LRIGVPEMNSEIPHGCLVDKKDTSQIYFWIFLTAAICFLSLSVVGGITHYSPLFFWDSWECIAFIDSFSSGNWQALWAQHNEHRIILTKLLFFLDFLLFKGNPAPLIILNYILVGLSCFFFIWAWKETQSPLRFIPCFLVSCLFFWSQSENFEWEFQSQFFLVHLLAFIAFFFLYKSQFRTHRKTYFILSIIVGIFSAGTMATGIFVLPLMFFYGLLAKIGKKKIIIILTLSILILYIFFYDYHFSSKTLGYLFLNINEFVKYIFVYLGNPFFYLSSTSSLTIASFFGKVFLSLFLYSCMIIYRKNYKKIYIVFFIFIFYIIIESSITSIGRMQYGISQAIAHRYTTPTIMAWCILYLMFFSKKNIQKINLKLCNIISIFIIVAMFPIQLNTLYIPSSITQKNIAFLAILSGIHDDIRIKNIVYLDTALNPFQAAEKAQKLHLKNFCSGKLKDLSDKVNSLLIISQKNSRQSQGNLELTSPIATDQNWSFVQGWFYDKSTTKYPLPLLILDENHTVVGVAITGVRRPDVASTIDQKATYSGFEGYLHRKAIGTIRFYSPETKSFFSATVN
jgi:hypothetical protein